LRERVDGAARALSGVDLDVVELREGQMSADAREIEVDSLCHETGIPERLMGTVVKDSRCDAGSSCKQGRGVLSTR